MSTLNFLAEVPLLYYLATLVLHFHGFMKRLRCTGTMARLLFGVLAAVTVAALCRQAAAVGPSAVISESPTFAAS